MKLFLTNFSIKHPWIITVLALVMTGMFAAQFPKVKFDNDPENMLAENEYIRLFHNKVKTKFSLYDFVIAGVVNEKHPDGIFNVDTLNKIHELTNELISLRKNDDGKPVVDRTSKNGNVYPLKIDLAPTSLWKRILAIAFRHDPNNLFDDQGNSAIIDHEIISPSVVDNIKQAELGSLKIEYLMENPPRTREEALQIRNDAMNNPLYKGTLVSGDGKAICIYIPIKAKTYSYNVAVLVKKLAENWKGDEKIYITGQPVAQDTFGVEMLVQMAVSAPMAGLFIFLLLLFFFKRVSLIVAPMIVAVISVVCAMGLLIGLGFDVHIMSSMIAIFLMPIAVADSVHILSEFYDLYHKFNDKAKTIKHVINHLFMPMLYTSLTTVAGFASLAVTPIPPVRVFGLHVAFGIALAFILTITLIPAYIIITVPIETLQKLGKDTGVKNKKSYLAIFLEKIGLTGYKHRKLVLFVSVLVIIVSIIGITRIKVNDNPVKWFTEKHPIRVADKVLNKHFGGTYTAYLTLSGKNNELFNPEKTSLKIQEFLDKRFGKTLPTATKQFVQEMTGWLEQQKYNNKISQQEFFQVLYNIAGNIDKDTVEPWNTLADKINYLEPGNLSYKSLKKKIKSFKKINKNIRDTLVKRLSENKGLKGEALMDRALEICDEYTAMSFRNFIEDLEPELTAPLFKRPQMLKYVAHLQQKLLEDPVVGKTSSAVDALVKASYELNYQPIPENASPMEIKSWQSRNKSFKEVPSTAAAVGQVYTQLEQMKKKNTLFHLVTDNYEEVNIWVQLKSGDNVDMETVVTDVQTFMKKYPPPVELNVGWAGLTYLNVIWQDKMVRGMLSSLFSSFAVVLVMMIVLFRSLLYGILSMIPLSVTISFIYGLIGLVGKDYDMPVAVLSALTLGLSVDFAIHFLERAREEQESLGNWEKACAAMFKEPAMAISRNAITISIGFTPLLIAPLVPYQTVGFFLATIMVISWIATLFILPAMLTVLKKWVFKKTR